MKALSDPTLSLDLLARALLATGVPIRESAGLKQKEASALLQRKLQEYLSRIAEGDEDAAGGGRPIDDADVELEDSGLLLLVVWLCRFYYD